MALLSFAGAIVALLVGALVLNFTSQHLEGRRTYFLHFGLLLQIVVVGGALFPLWGWTSTGWVLGISALLTLSPPLWERLVGQPPRGYLYHGDDPRLNAAEEGVPGDE